MAGTVANDGKWKSFANGQVLYGPAGSGQNLNTDLEGNAANDIDSQVAEIVGDATVSGHLVAAGVGLAVTITAGTTYCAGQRVKTTSSGGVGSLPASTSGIKIYAEPMTPWSTTNRAWPANFAFTTGALAAGQVLLATVTTDGSNVTVVTDGRVLFSSLGSIVGSSGPFVRKIGDTMTGDLIVGDGVTAGPRTLKIDAPAANVAELDFRSAGATKWSLYRPAASTDLALDSAATANVMRFTQAGTLTMGGHVLFSPDNTFDIGAAGATRPRTLYAVNVVLANNAASAGIIRLPNNNAIAWRNPGNTADNTIKLNASDAFEFSASITLPISGQAMLINGATTGLSYFQWTNTGGAMFVGLGSSALGGLFVGGTAYAASIGSTNATSLELATNNTIRFRVDSTGVSRSLGILTIEGAGGTIGATSVGIELRGSATPSLTAYNRSASAYLNMQYDAGSHEHLISGVVTHRMIGTTADPEFHFQNTGVGSVFHVFKTNSTTRWLLGVASATTKFIFFDGTANRLVLRNGGLMTQIDQDYTATYTPQAQLGTTAAATVGDVQIVGSQTSASADTAVLEFINHAVGTGAEPRLAAIAARRAAANNTGDLAFYTTAAGVITAKVVLTSAGVLLVGTAVATGSSAGDITIAQGSSYRSLMTGSTSQVMLRSTSIGGSDVTQLTNGSGSIPVIGAPATVGGASGGDLVLAGTASIRFANNAGSTTLRGFDKDTSDVFHIAGAGGNVKLVSDTVLIGSSIIALGTTAAATGAIRLQSQDKISSRNAANSADLELLTADSTNRLALGAGTTYVRIVNTLRCDIDSTSRFVLPVGSAKYAT